MLPAVTMKVVVFIVNVFMALLNVTETAAVAGTFDAPFARLTMLTAGGVVSGAVSPFPPPPPHAKSRGRIPAIPNRQNLIDLFIL